MYFCVSELETDAHKTFHGFRNDLRFTCGFTVSAINGYFERHSRCSIRQMLSAYHSNYIRNAQMTTWSPYKWVYALCMTCYSAFNDELAFCGVISFIKRTTDSIKCVLFLADPYTSSVRTDWSYELRTFAGLLTLCLIYRVCYRPWDRHRCTRDVWKSENAIGVGMMYTLNRLSKR